MSKIDFTQLKTTQDDAASRMPSLDGKKILMGYWHNWPAGPRTATSAGSLPI